MKVSVCITIFNEEKSIARLLDSLLVQTKKPDEIVIIDGGSKDKTIKIVKHYQKKERRIKLISEPGSLSHGRNVSIELARNDVVALTDASCVARKDWLELITEPFKHKYVGLVAGFYDMCASTPLNESLNVFLGVPSERFDPTSFIPSARSVAFRKDIWERVGGFDERLDKAGEDTKFFYQCVKAGVKIVRVKQARVEWEESADMSFFDAIKKFKQYAKGDAQAKIWWHPEKHLASHNIKISMIFVRYALGLTVLGLSFIYPLLLYLLIIGFILYLFWSIWKWRDVITDFKAKLWLPIIQVTSDLAVMYGFASGTLSK